jgi:hypothetical protein
MHIINVTNAMIECEKGATSDRGVALSNLFGLPPLLPHAKK